MRTSLNELQEIEGHLTGTGKPEDQLVFEAKALLDPHWEEKVFWQKRAYEVVQTYGREALRKEIRQVHRKLFTQPKYSRFRQKIMNYFH